MRSYQLSYPGLGYEIQIVAPPRIARGSAAYETAEVLLLQGAMMGRELKLESI